MAQQSKRTKKQKNYVILLVVAFIVTSITAFANIGGGDQVSQSSSGLPAVTANAGEAPTITAPTGTAPTTLESKDIIVGTGVEVTATSTLTVHYTLMTWSNGKVVESSWTGGQPATFPLSGVIQ